MSQQLVIAKKPKQQENLPKANKLYYSPTLFQPYAASCLTGLYYFTNHLNTLWHNHISPALTLKNMNIAAQTILWATCIVCTFHPLGFLVNALIAATWAAVDTTVEVLEKHNAEKGKFIRADKTLDEEKWQAHKQSMSYKKTIFKTTITAFLKNVAINIVYLFTPPVAKGLFRVAFSKFMNRISTAFTPKPEVKLPGHQTPQLYSPNFFQNKTAISKSAAPMPNTQTVAAAA